MEIMRYTFGLTKPTILFFKNFGRYLDSYKDARDKTYTFGQTNRHQKKTPEYVDSSKFFQGGVLPNQVMEAKVTMIHPTKPWKSKRYTPGAHAYQKIQSLLTPESLIWYYENHR